MNANELLIKDMLEKRGFRVLRNGWPDFLCMKEIKKRANWNTFAGGPAYDTVQALMAVEVKAGSDRLSEAQKQVHRALRSVRIPVHVIKADKAEIPKLNVRHLMTHAELKHLSEIAQSAKARLEALREDAAKLVNQIQDIDATIEASSVMLNDSSYLLETDPVLDEMPSYSLPNGD